jgi:hypothetical protein
METLKVIVVGLGGVGSRVAKSVVDSEWAELVGAVDIAADLVGKDVSASFGGSARANVSITSDIDALLDAAAPDVVVAATTSSSLSTIYPEIVGVLERGVNVITPCMDVSDPWLYDAETTALIERACQKSGATFLGIGSTQLVIRSLLALAETCRLIERVKCFVHADVSKFTLTSKQQEFGVLLGVSDYDSAVASGRVKGRRALRKEARLLANSLGLAYDREDARYEPIVEQGTVVGVDHIFTVGIGDRTVVEYTYRFIEDAEHRYFHEFEIDAAPKVGARLDFSSDRGLEGTVVPLMKCLPAVVAAAPGIISMLDLPLGLNTADLVNVTHALNELPAG